MTVSIEEIPACRIVYIRSIGPYGAENAQAMARLKNWAREKGLMDDDSVILGIAWDDPQTVPPQSCRYDTCIVLPKDYILKDTPISEGVLAGGRYAVFKIAHTAEAVQKAWGDIFPEIIAQGWYMDDKRPILERYSAPRMRAHLCELCVPIR
jgi:DNA gyrase inhibitor GyrI